MAKKPTTVENIEKPSTKYAFLEDSRHKLVSLIVASGTEMLFGAYHHERESSLFLFTDEQAEPTYFTAKEADLIIASLVAAKEEARDQS